MNRIWAIVERELRRFGRNPALVVTVLIMPLVNLVVLGYAFGGPIRHIPLAVVDQDHAVPAVRVRELVAALVTGARAIDAIEYDDFNRALADLRSGAVSGVLTIPPDFSRRTLADMDPKVAVIVDNTDTFLSTALTDSLKDMMAAYPQTLPARYSRTPTLEVVEVYPYIPYIQYLLPGCLVLALIMAVTAGGGFTYIDDRVRGLHEGYLVTPITTLELIFGFNLSATVKAIVISIVPLIAGSFIAGIHNPLDPVRLAHLTLVIATTAYAVSSFVFVLMARIVNPGWPRTVTVAMNLLLYFPSGAMYPIQSFPSWLKILSAVDPLTYAVHALRSVLLKGVSAETVLPDVLILIVYSVISTLITACLFKRTLS